MTFDDIEGIELAGSPKGHRQAAATLVAWAAEPHPDDEATPADLLSSAAWHLQQAGDVEQSLALHRSAVEAGETTGPSARVLLHAALVEAGQLDEARRVADEVRRSSPGIADIAMVAETFEMAGDLREANRWVGIGLNRVDLDTELDAIDDDSDLIILLNVRRRVREQLGFPPDEIDALGS